MSCIKCNYKPKFCPECGTDNTDDSSEFRMIIHGLPSSGVSSTANTILGENRFETGNSFDGITKSCQSETCERFGSLLKIVDTPGFVIEETESSPIERFNGINKGIDILKPGPHVLIIVFQSDGFNEESRIFIRNLRCLESISKYGIVIFTKADMVDKDRSETKRKIEGNKDIGKLLQLTNNRFLFFDNINGDKKQVEDLLEIVQKLVEDNKEPCFDTAIFGHDLTEKLATIDKHDKETKCSKNDSLEGSLGVQ